MIPDWLQLLIAGAVGGMTSSWLDRWAMRRAVVRVTRIAPPRPSDPEGA